MKSKKIIYGWILMVGILCLNIMSLRAQNIMTQYPKVEDLPIRINEYTVGISNNQQDAFQFYIEEHRSLMQSLNYTHDVINKSYNRIDSLNLLVSKERALNALYADKYLKLNNDNILLAKQNNELEKSYNIQKVKTNAAWWAGGSAAGVATIIAIIISLLK